jgi:hypothetical protein
VRLAPPRQVSYDIGTVAFLIGLGLVVAPHPFRRQLSFRSAAVFLVALACVGHVLWALFDPWRRSP